MTSLASAARARRSDGETPGVSSVVVAVDRRKLKGARQRVQESREKVDRCMRAPAAAAQPRRLTSSSRERMTAGGSVRLSAPAAVFSRSTNTLTATWVCSGAVGRQRSARSPPQACAGTAATRPHGCAGQQDVPCHFPPTPSPPPPPKTLCPLASARRTPRCTHREVLGEEHPAKGPSPDAALDLEVAPLHAQQRHLPGKMGRVCTPSSPSVGRPQLRRPRPRLRPSLHASCTIARLGRRCAAHSPRV